MTKVEVSSKSGLTSPVYYAAGFAVFLFALVSFYLLAPADSARATGAERKRVTIFDGAFWASGDNIEPAFDELLGEMNPLTGNPYTQDQIERVRKLYRLFPQNSLLPRPASERFRKEKEQERLETLSRQITAGTATESEIKDFYAQKSREVRDRMELVQHVLTEPWEEEVLATYRNILNQDKNREALIAEELQNSLQILKNRQQSE
ncbi:MAG: hypothetical protein JNM27_22100 [Leptospirales bacterium]|nr:hypothetical protein [Leptospirales bacterium]